MKNTRVAAFRLMTSLMLGLAVLSLSVSMAAPQAIQGALQDAYRLHKSGQYEAAIEKMLEVLPQNPHNQNLYYLLADSYAKTNHWQDAQVYYHKTMTLDPNTHAATLAQIALEQIDKHVKRYGDKNLQYNDPFKNKDWAVPDQNFKTIAFNPAKGMRSSYLESASIVQDMVAQLNSGAGIFAAEQKRPPQQFTEFVTEKGSPEKPYTISVQSVGQGGCKVSGKTIDCTAAFPEFPQGVVFTYNGLGNIDCKGCNPYGRTESYSYIDKIAEDGYYERFPASKMPLKIWIEKGGLGDSYLDLATKAMDAWVKASDKRITYVLVDNEHDGDIRVHWNKFLGLSDGYLKEGTTQQKKKHDKTFKEVKISVVGIDKIPYHPKRIYCTLVHEYGHALGFNGHSDSANDIMYFSETGRETGKLSDRDINTIRQLYSMEIFYGPEASAN